MPRNIISINRAPVLTLWAAVVAERIGYKRDEALTFGGAVAGLNAQSKGRRLGIFEERPKKAREKKPGEQFRVEICGRAVPAVNTDEGVRAVRGKKPIDPESVERYLQGKFGDDLKRVRRAMQRLAKAFRPKKLAEEAYSLYEEFRPSVPEGKRGWGAKGDLDLDRIRSLAKARS